MRPLPPAGAKQERRGGIETRQETRDVFSLDWGSRNAVVALKPDLLDGPILEAQKEAGTPWWH